MSQMSQMSQNHGPRPLTVFFAFLVPNLLFPVIYDIIIMKDEKVWDYSQCQIGHPCDKCTDTCSFKITYSLVEGQDEKENEYE